MAALSAAIWLETWAAVAAEASGVGVVPTAQAMVIPVTPAVAAATTDEDTTLLRLRRGPCRGAAFSHRFLPRRRRACGLVVVVVDGRLGGRRRGGSRMAGWSARSVGRLTGRLGRLGGWAAPSPPDEESDGRPGDAHGGGAWSAERPRQWSKWWRCRSTGRAAVVAEAVAGLSRDLLCAGVRCRRVDCRCCSVVANPVMSARSCSSWACSAATSSRPGRR